MGRLAHVYRRGTDRKKIQKRENTELMINGIKETAGKE
jgi:hypothetical protein